jgi:hypothetical protein
MTADPDRPDEPHIQPASGGDQDKPNRPRPSLLEGRALPLAGAGGEGIMRPLAAGLVGGLVGAGIVYLMSSSAGVDADARKAANELTAKVAELSEALNAKAASSSVASSEQLSEVRSRIDTVASSVKTAEEGVRSVAQKVQALEQKPSADISKETMHADIASQIAPVSSQIAPLADRVAGLEALQNERVSDARTAALTIALSNLKRAVAEGRAFATELSAVETLSPSKLPVSELAANKDQGVPSLGELQRSFKDVSRNVITKHYQGKSDSFVGEVLSRARAAVQVRPSGGAGDTVEAQLGRIESALKAGDLKGALTEAQAIEGPAKQELQAWLERANARAAADEALRKTDAELLASLSKSPARRP